MADDIKATPPKNKGALGVAKAVQKAHEFLSKPFGYQNPPGALLSELMSLPSVAQTFERIGYGEPLTTGAGGLGGTSRPRPEVIEAAMAIAPLAQMTKNLPVGAATVWHGSPHKFAPTPKNPLGEFDPKKIGTGEGNQSFGYGHYTAEAPGVATDYKRKLSNTLNVDGDATPLEKRAAEMALTFGDNTSDGAIKWLEKHESKGTGHTVPALTPELIQSVKQKFAEGVFSPAGHLYKIDLADEAIPKMLDWDKPLSQQPEVIKALKGTDYEIGLSQKEAEKIADQRLREEAYEWADNTGGDPVDYINNADWEKYVDDVRKESGNIDSNITGAQLHKIIMKDSGYRPELFDPHDYQINTSETLKELGIPGIKYLDQASRNAGEGTSNFVVFPGNEDLLTILERKKEGGIVMSDNPDTMMLELQDKKYQFGGLVRRGADAAKKGIPFFSKVDEVAKELPRTKGTGAEFMKELEKTKGVKPAEIQHRKLDEIKAMPKMTKEQFIGELEKRPPAQLEEKVLGGQQEFDAKRLAQLEKEYRGLKQHPIDDPSFGEEKYNELIRLMNIRDQSTVNTLYNAAEQATRSAQRAQQQGNRLTAEKYFREAEFLNTRAEKLDLQGQGQVSPPKYDKYVLPGGQNYREILLKLTNKPQPLPEGFEVNAYSVNGKTKYGVFDEKGQRYGSGDTKDEALQRFSNLHQQKPYESSHWQGEPNVIAHARVSDRIGPNGEKVLHVEEIQSDWHQAGRKKGYANKNAEQEYVDYLNDLQKRVAEDIKQTLIKDGIADEKAATLGQKMAQRIADDPRKLADYLGESEKQMSLHQARLKAREGVPDAPFKKNWHELMMNRILADAAENGYDRVALTPGVVQAERYDLSKQVSGIGWNPETKTLLARRENDPLQIKHEGITAEKLADYIGKDAAEKLLKSPANDGWHMIEGKDLAVGGVGMKGFYDKMLPDYLNSLGKKYGVEVEPVGINIHSDLEGFMPKDQMEHKTLHGFKITPEMRQEFTEKGFPMYSIAAPVGLGATQIEMPQAPRPVQISDNPDAMMMELGDRGFAGGGLLKKAAKAMKGTQEVLPAAEREANLQKFLESSAVKERLYHGTVNDVSQFDANKASSRTGNPNAQLGHFFSANPKEASRYASDFGTTEGGNVMPVYLNIKNPKRLTYKEMDDLAMAMFDKNAPVNDWKNPGFKERQAKRYEEAKNLSREKKQELIDAGYDGAVVKIGGHDEYIAFYPEQVKSAIGNKGTYDTSKPDINEASGGLIRVKNKRKAKA